MKSLESWWWPKRPARVPRARTAGLLAGLGAALFGVSAVLLKTGTLGWDESLFRLLNEVPAAAASVLTPLSRLFLPAGIITVVALIVVYVLARNRSILPVVAGAAAAGVAWLLAHVAKAIADRSRPYQVMADAVLRQQPAHGTSFPPVTPPSPWRLRSRSCRSWPGRSPGRGSGMPSWRAGPACTWGCTIPWTSWAEQVSAWRRQL